MTFQYVKPTDEQKELLQTFRDKFDILTDDIYDKVRTTRGKSKAVSRLEESFFWLQKAIVEGE